MMVRANQLKVAGLIALALCGTHCGSTPEKPAQPTQTSFPRPAASPELPRPTQPTTSPLVRSYLDQRTNWVAQLAQTVSACVDRTDTQHVIFHGCIDWHSAAHAHYALLAASRITGQPQFREIVDKNLTPESIAQEARWLSTHPRFEMPYGRAWFLRLAIEDAKQKPGRLTAMADEVVRSLLDWFAQGQANLEGVDYNDASWALRQLHDYCQDRANQACQQSVHDLVQKSMLAPLSYSLSDDHSAFTGFFSPWALRAHLLETASSPAQFQNWIQAAPSAPASLSPIQNTQTDHHLGINFSRAWGLFSTYLVLKQDLWLQASVNHLQAAMQAHPQLKDNYHAYAHWVPQFGIYAMDSMRPELIQQDITR